MVKKCVLANNHRKKSWDKVKKSSEIGQETFSA